MASVASISLLFSLARSAGAVSLRIETPPDSSILESIRIVAEKNNQVFEKLHPQDDPCACLAWQDVYSKGSVWCGAGKEFMTYKMENQSAENMRSFNDSNGDLYAEWCTRFFTKMPGSSCLNGEFSMRPRQWCYVSSECPIGKLTASADVHAKWCDVASGDEMANTKTPEELNSFAKNNTLDLGLLAKLSYHVHPLPWTEVEDTDTIIPSLLKSQFHMKLTLSGGKYFDHHHALKSSRKELKDVMKSGVATIFQEDNGRGPGTLVIGNTIYASTPVDNTPSVNSSLYYVCKFIYNSSNGTTC